MSCTFFRTYIQRELSLELELTEKTFLINNKLMDRFAYVLFGLK